jgi:heat-inducible transcriptional repressor
MAISSRKQVILQTIIKEYLKTAQPVSSGFLVAKSKLGISPATVRNEMMELEEAGYIYQPHTSAGRIPTALAYELYVQEFIDQKKIAKIADQQGQVLDKIFELEEASFKQVAKMIAELSQAAVFWAFHKNNLYYTGISNLFSQAEFKQVDLVYDVSSVIDQMEEIIDRIFNKLPMGEQVLIGRQNPFGDFLSTVIVKYNLGNQSGVFGILGPLRMDYENNLALANYIKKKLIK